MQNIKNKFDNFKSGFIAIAGAPNSGKSTLLNRLLGEKISITSKKPQTTRNRILGVLSRPFSQFIFIDTPGVHKAKGSLNMAMVETAFSAIGDVDAVLFLVDVSNPDPDSENIVVKKLKKQKTPIVLALNKIDLVKKHILLNIIDKWAKIYSFESIVPISAKNKIQLDVLLKALKSVLPFGPPLFPEETLTDMPEKFIAAEIIREKIFRLTGQEIPYSTAVTIDSFSEAKKPLLIKIKATIHVEHNSQKGIIIGKKGTRLKDIGERARREIQRMVGAKVYLKLFVRVQKNWSNDAKALQRLGYL